MSLLLDYRKDKTTSGLDFGTRNGTVNLQQPIYLDSNKKKAFRVIRCIMSPEIPNIYSYGNFNNTIVKITNDGGLTWITVSLPFGIYTIKMIQDSINNVANQLSWYKPNQVALEINYNPATKFVYTKIDSTQLALGTQMGIDYGASQMYQLLGYTFANSKILIDGLFTATEVPQVDSQGTYVEVTCSIIQNVRWINGTLSKSIVRIPINLQSGSVEIIYPSTNTGMISPLVPASIPSFIQSYDISILNSKGTETVFLYGSFILELEIVDL